jgi:hypothetical protein
LHLLQKKHWKARQRHAFVPVSTLRTHKL